MKIEFAQPIRQIFQDAGDEGRAHFSCVPQAENVIGKRDTGALQLRDDGPAQACENRGQQRGRTGFADEAQGMETVLDGHGEGEAKDGGVEMQMGVAVPVGRGEAERAEPVELCADFLPECAGEGRAEGVAQAGAGGRDGELIGLVCEGRDGRDGRSTSIAEREMQADAQGWMTARDLDGFVGRRLVDHEAGLGEEPRFMAALDGFVDFGAAAEVVAGDDEGFQFEEGTGKLPAPR